MDKEPHRKRSNKHKRLWLGLVILLTLLGAWYWHTHSPGTPGTQPVSRIQAPANLASLLALPTAQLESLDLAQVNLLCAEGLPGIAPVDVTAALATLDTWAQRVKTETDRHRYRFERNPAEFEQSEGFFRMLMLAVVLAEDFQVKYHPQKRNASAAAGDGFFAQAQDVFLPGLLGPQRQGTCSSLPVLYVAIGRRLGYPLKLVTTKGHLFVRWEGAKERFNIEAAGQGVNRFDDAYYRQWPFAVSKAEVAAEGHLKSLTASEELAVFLSIRGMCQMEAGQRAAAAESFAAAARLAPGCRSYRLMAERLGGVRTAAVPLTK